MVLHIDGIGVYGDFAGFIIGLRFCLNDWASESCRRGAPALRFYSTSNATSQNLRVAAII